MKTHDIKLTRIAGIFAVAVATSFVVASCATTPESPLGAAEVRSKLNALQSNSTLAEEAPVEIREAAAAVTVAEQPVGKDTALGEHRVYMADQQVEIALATASTRYAESEREALSRQRGQARLDARTREADRANLKAESARASASLAAVDAARREEELQQQIDLLEAEATDRGLVLTLGDVLFATGRSDLKMGGTNTLDKLAAFLNEYPSRDVIIEGHTDNVGSLEMNQALSESRADSVKSYLVQQGIQSGRLFASGMGETRPIADNLSGAGRQQNRRVEVIIQNPASKVPTASTE